MDRTKALLILERYVEDDLEQITLLDETAVTLTVLGQAVTLYDPYAAALAHLMHPDALKARTEGSVSETYVDHKEVVGYLQGKSAELRASWPVDDGALPTVRPNLTLTFGGW
jgi:hypothetical protein